MRGAMRILALPFTSETTATAIGGLGVTMMMLPLIYYCLAIRLTEWMAQIVVLISHASPMPLLLASVSLWHGAGFRRYRDNTRSRAACEFLSLIFLLCALMALRISTI